MPIDRDGQVFHDLVSPPGPAVPVDPARPPDVVRTVDALAKASPEQQRQFLRSRKQQMDPATYAKGLAALLKAGYQQQAGSESNGNNHTEGESVAPAGTYHPSSPLPRRPGPAEPNDPAYAAILAASGVRYGSQRYLNDPGVK